MGADGTSAPLYQLVFRSPSRTEVSNKRNTTMYQYKVQIWTKQHGMLETIITAGSIGRARALAQEQYPDAHIGCIRKLD